MTRGEVASIIFNLVKDANKNSSVTGNFIDVKSTDWYANAINYLASKGILNGKGNEKFDPTAPITRGEFATIIAKFSKLTTDSTKEISDVNTDFWAAKSISAVYNEGWIHGYPDGTFKPKRNITRAEAVTIINSMLKIDKSKVSKISKYSDLSTDNWAYADIMAASK